MLVCLAAVSCGTASKVSQEQTAQTTVAVVDSESVVKDSISTGETKSDYHEVISSEEAPAKTSRIPWIVRVLGWIGGFSVVFLVLWVLRKFRVI